MILIADSGSTSTNWVICNKGNAIESIFTPGINPFYQTEEQIAESIRTHLLPRIGIYPITSIYFYGAGCVSDKCGLVTSAIQKLFPKASIEVNSDLVAAARGLLQHNAGIACIIGTGSNSCRYDGNAICESISPLGFILGDEGSGAVLGKLFIGNCLKNQVPEKIKNAFLEQYKLTPSDILNNVYKQPFPNRFLAQFSPFLLAHLHEPSVYNLVFDSFTDFLVRNVMQYDLYQEQPISFTGSIAYHFKDVLEVVMIELGLTLGTVVQSPLEGLVAFHRSNN